jgi:AcrR family transcriptional regulator
VEKRQRIARTAVDLIRAIAEDPPTDSAADAAGGTATAPRPGLRERKKQQTREAISDIATNLFIQRGFEPVTLAEIAEAAQVSVKTIFNYFGSKEELFFDRADDVYAELRKSITERPKEMTITRSMERQLTWAATPLSDVGWGMLEDQEAYEQFRSYREAEQRSPALTARRVLISEQWTRDLAGVLREELKLGQDDPRADGFAAMLLAAFTLRDRTLSDALIARRPLAEIRTLVERVVGDLLPRIGRAYEDLDRPA